MPQNLDQTAVAPAEHKQLPAMRIKFELLLNQKSQARKAFAHIRMPGSQPDPCAARDCHHDRGSTTARSRASTPMSISASTRRIRPPRTSISIRCEALVHNEVAVEENLVDAVCDPSSATDTAKNSCADTGLASDFKKPKLRRQPNNCAGEMLCRRAVHETRRGPAALSITIRNFSSSLHRRRRPVSTIWRRPPCAL